MAAPIIEFPQPTHAAPPVQSTDALHSIAPTLRRRGLHLVKTRKDLMPTITSSQELAYRIVAQVEREIAHQSFARQQRRLNFNPPTPAVLETPAGVTRRILHALIALARPA